jgi:hypothetical protein
MYGDKGMLRSVSSRVQTLAEILTQTLWAVWKVLERLIFMTVKLLNVAVLYK